MSERPIGIFDSGVGGTSIWKEIQGLLPCENTLYLADSRNAPYGEKSKDEIIQLSIKNTEFLLSQKCKLIVVACNTATTNAISVLREKYEVPIIGIEPAIKPAALQSTSKIVGILATKGTLSSHLFHSTAENHAHGIRIVEQVGTGLVPLIEEGKIDSPEMETLLKKYTAPMVEAGIDHLVLGCTHYPYLIPKLKKLLPESVKIIDSGEAVARQVRSVLEKNGMANLSKERGRHLFYSNSRTTTLQNLISDVDADTQVSLLEF